MATPKTKSGKKVQKTKGNKKSEHNSKTNNKTAGKY